MMLIQECKRLLANIHNKKNFSKTIKIHYVTSGRRTRINQVDKAEQEELCI